MSLSVMVPCYIPLEGANESILFFGQMSFGDLTIDRMSRHLFIESNQTKEVFLSKYLLRLAACIIMTTYAQCYKTLYGRNLRILVKLECLSFVSFSTLF